MSIKARKIADVGERFGRLVVVRRAPDDGGHSACEFGCDCGAIVVRRMAYVRCGRMRSCGCLQRETARARLLTHGESGKTVEHATWLRMLARCNNSRNPDYARYGGRGIQICDRWARSYENFLADMGRRPGLGYSIDRIDNDGHYSPDNCRWATDEEQQLNKRSNHRVTWGDRTKTIKEWSVETGIPYGTLLMRIRAGWSVEDAMTKPLQKFG